MANAHIGEGFHQPIEDTITTKDLNDEIININVYPNPFSDIVFIDSKIKSDLYITIINSIGQSVYQTQSAKMERMEISVQHLPPGIYMLIAKTDNDIVKSFKLIKK